MIESSTLTASLRVIKYNFALCRVIIFIMFLQIQLLYNPIIIIVLRGSVQENQAVSKSSLSHFFKISVKRGKARSIIQHTTYKLWRSATMHFTPTLQIAWFSGTLPLYNYTVLSLFWAPPL